MQGVFPAIITPFDKNGDVDYNGLETNINFLIDSGVNGIVCVGTTGESPTLSYDEHKKVIEKTVEIVNGRVKVIAGTGSNCTREAILLSEYAEDVGADGVLLVVPYYNKPTQKGLIKHFGEIANSINADIVLYNIPSRSSIDLSVDTIKYLSEEYSNINYLKEANPNLSRISDIINSCDIRVFSGNDELTLPILSLGGCGVISVVANILPKEMVEMVNYALNNQYDKSRKMHYYLYDIMKAMFLETNPIPIKTAMNMIGLPSGGLRLPLSEMEDKNREKLKEILKKYGLL